MNLSLEDAQIKQEDARHDLIAGLCRAALGLNDVIELGQGNLSETGLKSLRGERDRIASDLYEEMKSDDGSLFLVMGLIAQAEVPFVGEINHEHQTVYFYSFYDLPKYGNWD